METKEKKEITINAVDFCISGITLDTSGVMAALAVNESLKKYDIVNFNIDGVKHKYVYPAFFEAFWTVIYRSFSLKKDAYRIIVQTNSFSLKKISDHEQAKLSLSV